MSIRVLTMAVATSLASASVALPCVLTSEVPAPVELIQSADAIIRVVAAEYADGGATAQYPNRSVTFRIVETLKGDIGAANLQLPGLLTSSDNLNDRDVPYRFGRQPESSGACFAFAYRKGASYLLLLKRRQEGLTPSWQPLAPVNEQLKSDQDPWLRWVRARVAGAK